MNAWSSLYGTISKFKETLGAGVCLAEASHRTEASGKDTLPGASLTLYPRSFLRPELFLLICFAALRNQSHSETVDSNKTFLALSFGQVFCHRNDQVANASSEGISIPCAFNLMEIQQENFKWGLDQLLPNECCHALSLATIALVFMTMMEPRRLC